MRAVKAKALRRKAAKENTSGSKLRYRKDGSMFWIGARRRYQELKSGVSA